VFVETYFFGKAEEVRVYKHEFFVFVDSYPKGFTEGIRTYKLLQFV